MLTLWSLLFIADCLIMASAVTTKIFTRNPTVELLVAARAVLVMGLLVFVVDYALLFDDCLAPQHY